MNFKKRLKYACFLLLIAACFIAGGAGIAHQSGLQDESARITAPGNGWIKDGSASLGLADDFFSSLQGDRMQYAMEKYLLFYEDAQGRLRLETQYLMRYLGPVPASTPFTPVYIRSSTALY